MNYTPKIPDHSPFYAKWMKRPTKNMLMGNQPYSISFKRYGDKLIEHIHYELYFGTIDIYNDCVSHTNKCHEYLGKYKAQIRLGHGFKLWVCFLDDEKLNFELWKQKNKKLYCYNYKENKIQIGWDRDTYPIYRKLDREDIELIEEVFSTSKGLDSYILNRVIMDCEKLYYKKKEEKDGR